MSQFNEKVNKGVLHIPLFENNKKFISDINIIQYNNISVCKSSITNRIDKDKIYKGYLINKIEDTANKLCIINTLSVKNISFGGSISIKLKGENIFSCNIHSIITKQFSYKCSIINKVEDRKSYNSNIITKLENSKLFKSSITNKIENIKSYESSIIIKLENSKLFKSSIINKIENTKSYESSIITKLENNELFKSSITNKIEYTNTFNSSIITKLENSKLFKSSITNKIENTKSYDGYINVIPVRGIVYKSIIFNKLEKSIIFKSTIINKLESVNSYKCCIDNIIQVDKTFNSFITTIIDKSNIYKFSIINKLEKSYNVSCNVVTKIDTTKLFKSSIINIVENSKKYNCEIFTHPKRDKIVHGELKINPIRITNHYSSITTKVENTIKYNSNITTQLDLTKLFKSNITNIIEKDKLYNGDITVPLLSNISIFNSSLEYYVKGEVLYTAKLIVQPSNVMQFKFSALMDRISEFKSSIKVTNYIDTGFAASLYIPYTSTMHGNVTLEGGYTLLYGCNLTTRLDKDIIFNGSFNVPLFENITNFKSELITRIDKEKEFKCTFFIKPITYLEGDITTADSKVSKYFGKLIKDTYTNPDQLTANYGSENELILNDKNTILAEWEFPRNQDKKYDGIGEFETMFRIYLKKAIHTTVTITLYEIDITWSENNVSEYNKPYIPAESLAEFILPKNYVGPVDISLGNLLDGYDKINSGFNKSFAIVSDSITDISINSKEYTDNVLGLYYNYYIAANNDRLKINPNFSLYIGLNIMSVHNGTFTIPTFKNEHSTSYNLTIPTKENTNTFKCSLIQGTIKAFNSSITIPIITSEHIVSCFFYNLELRISEANGLISIPIFNNEIKINSNFTNIPMIFKLNESLIYTPRFDRECISPCSINIPIYEDDINKDANIYITSRKFNTFKSLIRNKKFNKTNNYKCIITIPKIDNTQSKEAVIDIPDYALKLKGIKMNVPKFDTVSKYPCYMLPVLDLGIFKSKLSVPIFKNDLIISGELTTQIHKRVTYKGKLSIPIFTDTHLSSAFITIKIEDELVRDSVITIPMFKKRDNKSSHIFIIPIREKHIISKFTIPLYEKIFSINGQYTTKIETTKVCKCIMYIGDGKRKVHIFWM